MKLSRYLLGVCLLVFSVGVGAETIEFFGTYTGDVASGIPHGQGTWTKSDGSKYVGGWKNGKKHGYGTFTWASGDKYVGRWKNGSIHGYGTFTWASGDKYVGEWRNGKFHGQGSETRTDGSKYVGEWKTGYEHGQGTYTYANGDKYVGSYKNGKYHGQGTYTYANGDKYVGEFKEGKGHGQGTSTSADGDKYVGEYKNRNRHGQGTYTRVNGDKYVGEYKYDSPWNSTVYNAAGEVRLLMSNGMPAPVCNGNRRSAWGTGFAVRPNHVVTVAHVVYCCKKVTVLDLSCSDSEEATVVATEQKSDLALLRLNTPLKHYATLRSGKELQLGEVVTTKDWRLEVNGCPQYVMGQGKVTEVDWMPDDSRLMVHDSPTSHGSSGGPVLDVSGYVVGVSIAATVGDSTAIKPHLLKAFLKSNNVEYNTAPSTEKLSLSDIKKKSDKFTVIIDCVM